MGPPSPPSSTSSLSSSGRAEHERKAADHPDSVRTLLPDTCGHVQAQRLRVAATEAAGFRRCGFVVRWPCAFAQQTNLLPSSLV